MLKSPKNYALYTKTLAMHGKMLKEDDWFRLCGSKSVSDICAYLANHRGWSGTVSAISQPTTKILQAAIRKRLYEEYEKIYKFTAIEDKKYLLLYLYRAEYRLILDALMDASGYERPPKSDLSVNFLRNHSSVDISALEQSRTFAEILEAVKGSVFEKALSGLKPDPETGLPNFFDAGAVLENAWYKAVFSHIAKNYRGLRKKRLEKALGYEADYLNIVSILRLRRSFPASLEEADGILIPVSFRLKPALLRSLKSADSEYKALEILRASSFGKQFEGIDAANMENLYIKAMEALCVGMLKSPDPDIAVPQAYLILKEFECGRLIRLIEAVACGLDPRNAF
jgi:V/A-type H+-transporting ATPase subunit C